MSPRRLLLAAALALGGCRSEEILHGLDEGQANQVVVALDEGGVSALKRRDDGGEGTWRIEVSRADSSRAQRLLSERELPRRRPPGFGDVFGKGSVVPTASEERALYLHALSGELARSIEAIDGVVEARVHIALAPQDPLRLEAAPPPRAAVLVKVRPAARARVDPLAPGIQSLVAGSVAGLEPAAVSVVVTESAALSPARPRARRTALLAAAASAAAVALALAAVGVAIHLGISPSRILRARP